MVMVLQRWLVWDPQRKYLAWKRKFTQKTG